MHVALLQQDEVLTELKCTAEQKEKIAELIKAALDEQRAAFQAMIGRGGVAAVAAAPAVPPPGGVAVGGAAGGGGGIAVAGGPGMAARFTGPGSVKYDYEKLA